MVINRLKLGLINFLGCISWIPKSVVQKHLEENEARWRDFCRKNCDFDEKPLRNNNIGRYITYQPKLTFLNYGRERRLWEKCITNGKGLHADFNTCEVIAVTNALINIGVEHNLLVFPQILAYFEKKGAVLSGYFGTAPKSIVRYMRNRGLKCQNITREVLASDGSRNRLMVRTASRTVYIMICQNTKTLFDGVHTMCIIDIGRGFQILNDYEGNRCYASLKDAVTSYNNGNSKLLALYGISI